MLPNRQRGSIQTVGEVPLRVVNDNLVVESRRQQIGPNLWLNGSPSVPAKNNWDGLGEDREVASD
jgi:hypothetical protein